MTTSPLTLLPGDTDLPDLAGPRRPRLCPSKGQTKTPCSGAVTAVRVSQRIVKIICLWETALHLSGAAEEEIFKAEGDSE